MRILRAACLALLALPLAVPLAASGQAFPSKPVRIVVPNAAGGASDTLARPTAQRLSELLGQPVIVDNRPGAGGSIAANMVAKAPADGYTIYLASVTHLAGPYFVKNIPYDSLRDFSPIVNVALIPNILLVQPSMPIGSVREFIDYAKKNPGRIAYGTYAMGSMNHLAGLLLSHMVGIDMEHVPYKGGAPAMTDLLSGQLRVAILAASTVLPQAKVGKVRMLGVIENRRFQSVPGVPTIGETVSGYALPDTWLGFIGPAGLPRPIVEQLNAETRKALQTPEVRQRLEGAGFEVTGNFSGEQFAQAMKSDDEIIRKIVVTAGIKPE